MNGNRGRRVLPLIFILAAAAVIVVRGITTIDLAGVDWLVVVVVITVGVALVVLLTVLDVRRTNAAEAEAERQPPER